MTLDPPSSILVSYLVNTLGVFAYPSNPVIGLDPLFTGSLPDEEDSAACVYDTVGILDARLMKTGATLEHFGIQIIVRYPTYVLGWTASQGIANALDGVKNNSVTVGGITYTLGTANRTSPIIALGEEEKHRLQLFSINAILTIQ